MPEAPRLIEQMMAVALTDEALAERIARIAADRRTFDKHTTDALLREAAARITK